MLSAFRSLLTETILTRMVSVRPILSTALHGVSRLNLSEDISAKAE